MRSLGVAVTESDCAGIACVRMSLRDIDRVGGRCHGGGGEIEVLGKRDESVAVGRRVGLGRCAFNKTLRVK